MIDWLIIGGGIHGTHLALVLTRRHHVPHSRVRILDPNLHLLAQWDRLTANTGMTYLRSPHVHNLHYDQGSLALYARIHEHDPDARFIPPFNRPTNALFRKHCNQLIAKHSLASLHVRGTAQTLIRTNEGWRVQTDHGDVFARRVILAIGSPTQPNIPDWARKLPSDRAAHIFSHDFSLREFKPCGHVVVIGGGISAVQVALYLAKQQPGNVSILMRHPLRRHDFDSDPGWMNRIHLRDYAKISDFDERRRVITAARHRGSIPPDVADALDNATQRGDLARIESEVRSVTSQERNRLSMTLMNGMTLEIQHVLLATGFSSNYPGYPWLSAAIEKYELPIASCGYPIVDPTLQWTNGLYVTGGLAELEIGPAARNIIGARLAGERLRNSGIATT